MARLTQDHRAPTEGGYQNHRIHFGREAPDAIGQPPKDYDWQLFSSIFRSAWEWEPDASIEGRRSLGSRMPQDFDGGPEEHEATFTYDMQKWFVEEDSNGDLVPYSAEFDCLFQTQTGQQPATHTVIDRETHAQGGTDGAGFYKYSVGFGGRPNEIETEAEAESAMPYPMGLTYLFEKVRQFVIHQPSSETGLVAVSDAQADSGSEAPSVTVEDEGATTTESVPLDGTSPVAIPGPFGSVDAVWLDDYAIGDVTIAINAGSESTPQAGTPLTKITGKATRSQNYIADIVNGDRGVPLLGGGSFEQPADIGPGNHMDGLREGYEKFEGRTLERDPAGDGLNHSGGVGPRISAATLQAENGYDGQADAASKRMVIDPGDRRVGYEASVAGPHTMVDVSQDHLNIRKADSVWHFAQGSLIFEESTNVEAGEEAAETEQAAMYVDALFDCTRVRLGDTDGNPVSVPALN
jgi:hypothetical protein